jgi:antitoxin Phd
MKVDMENILPYYIAENDFNSLINSVDEKGMMIVIKDDKHIYIVSKYDVANCQFEKPGQKISKNKLHEALEIVLSKVPDKTMHAAQLAEEIFTNGLYLKKDGSKVMYNGIRSLAGQYKHMFEVLPGNFIRLKGN